MQASDLTNETEVNLPCEPPQLRYQDQTPLGKQDSKRMRSELSPISELSNLDNIEKLVEAGVEKSLQKHFSQLSDQLINQMRILLDEAVKSIKTELRSEMISMEKRLELKMKSEAELLESYNRRENIRIIGVPEEFKKNKDRKFIGEDSEKTLEKVIGIANEADANVLPSDISITHRLPGRNGKPRPIIVRFSRRVARLEMLRKKKSLRDKEHTNGVSIFEDLTQPRVQFFNLMKQDNRIQSVWTREVAIYFVWKGNEYVQQVHGLYEGGDLLNYSFDAVENCFRRKE